MYVLLLLTFVGVGVWTAIAGRRSRALVAGGLLLAVATVGFFSVLSLWGEALWFEALGYGARFWTFLTAQGSTLAAGALAGFLGVYLLNGPARRRFPLLFPWAELAGAVGGGILGFGAWESALLFLNRVPAGIEEPILGQDAGFYLFTLPFLDILHGVLLWIAAVVVLSALGPLLPKRLGPGWSPADAPAPETAALPVAVASATVGAVVASGALLDACHLLYSEWGVVAGPGWTDVHVRLPGYLLLALLSLLLGATPLLPSLRSWTGLRLRRLAPALQPEGVAAAAGAWAAIGALWLALAGVLPVLFQWLVVEPNEITFETPYISNNIRFTRSGFGLDRVEERQYPAAEALGRETIEQNRNLISEIRLWDWRALKAVYKQFQEIRLYYEFQDVDMDRYTFGGRYGQIMASARELEPGNLPPQSQTFVNRRFKYTHGYGLTLATVSDFTPEGLPNLLVKDIPPKVQFPALAVTRPEIYYGELTDDSVVVNSSEPEFDHPRGDKNAYVHYAGKGGVPLLSLWRKFLYGWKFDGSRFLLSGYPTRQSRVMFHRNIRERVHTLAPFLTLDNDPYVVLAGGRLYWILDAYTTSRGYPYSEPFSAPLPRGLRGNSEGNVGYLDGVNYLRNSVKVVVDAYEGTVEFYVFDPEEPILRTWRRILPSLFRDRGAMPEALRAHVRYPQDLLLTQGLVYAKYHMSDPAVFYNQEDLWVRATEKHYDQVLPVEPYYIMWQLPGSKRAEFALMQPFTPKNRQVLIGWIAGLSDGDNYGRFLAYKFPKEKRVLGPQQVETKIDQDRFLSGQLTLWDQRGSHVIRGNVLAIPLGGTLLYVEPIYLQAETAAYPELRLVVTMHGDAMTYGESFDEALERLLGAGGPAAVSIEHASLEEIGRQANEAFQNYLKAQGEGRFQDAATALEILKTLLARLASEPEDTPQARPLPP